ncbi:MAG: SDR family NAD(P)-dependent oxidoreductase [Mycobacteriaceae bacterium]
MSAPIAVVTGASSGIGAATARQLAAQGFSVVVTARRRDRLDSLADEIGGRALTVDVTDADSVAALAEAVPDCAVVVNNAGGAFGMASVAEADEDQWRRMYETNVLGTMRVTKALLPALRASGRGHVVIVTSITAHEVYTGGAGYSAAKHAQAAVAETLRMELLGQPVRVSEIAPGMVRSEFSLVRFDGDTEAADAVYQGVDPLEPEDVADCIVWAVTRPPNVDVSLLRVTPLAQANNNTVYRRPVSPK